MNSFDINTLYSNAFGSNLPPSFTIPKAAAKPVQSSLGSPYVMGDVLGRQFFMPVILDGVLIPFAVLGINARKTIVKTPMPERGGSVHELISIDDYSINLRGLCISNDNSFPEADIIALHNIFLQNKSVEIRSALTDIFLKGTWEHMVIIEEMQWVEMPGVEHAKAFTMRLESDMINTLEIN